MKKSNIQKSGICIFCNGARLTKQHVIPDWISEYLVPAPHYQVITNPVLGIPIGEKTVIMDTGEPFVKSHNGTFGQFKIRNVCLNCNGGWISQQEQRSIPFIGKMIRGEDLFIAKADARKISVAIALMTMMNEFTDPNKSRRAIPGYHRRILKNTLNVPPNWYIGVGVMADDGIPRSRNHHMVTPHIMRYIESPASFHINTIRLNRLIFQAVVLENFGYPVAFKNGQLKQIWPYIDCDQGWQSGLLPLTEKDFLKVSDDLNHSILMAGVSNFSG